MTSEFTIIASAPKPLNDYCCGVALPRSCRVLVLQLTPFCNLDCDYCYLPNRSDTSRMSPAVLCEVLARLSSENLFAGDVLVNWHAGEPLVVGAAYFSHMLQQFPDATHGIVFHQSVQTNATLINEDFIELFKRHNVSMGVSIDGPQAVHDLYRRGRDGRGTHKEVMRGIDLLRRHSFKFATISVISDKSIDSIEDILAFLHDIGSSMIGFNVEEAEGANRTSRLASIGYARAVAFWERVIECACRLNLAVREVDRCIFRINRRTDAPNPSTRSGTFITIGATGAVSSFSPELLGTAALRFSDFRLGNLTDTNFSEIVNSQVAHSLELEIRRGVDACRNECEYFQLCGGGWPSNKFGEHGRFDVTETAMCRFVVKALLDAVLNMGCRDDVARYYGDRLRALSNS